MRRGRGKRTTLEGSRRRAGRRGGLGPGALVATGLLVAALPADGQVRDTIPEEERPFVPGGVYDKPYLARLLGRTALGGYAEAHARFERVDGVTEELGMEARRVNLFTSTRVSDFVRIGTELEIEEGGREITLEYAAIDVTLHPVVSLRAGMILVPLGRFNLAHDSPRNAFTDRPLVSTELLGVALSQPGLGAFGVVPLAGEARLTWEAYAVNGFGPGVVEASSDGTRIPMGKRNVEDENASPAAVGRVAWSPREGLELGLSGHHGAWNTFEVDGLDVEERLDLTILALDLEADVLGLAWEGEGVVASVELPAGLEGLYQSRQRGFYLQAVRAFGHGLVSAMPGSHFTVGARLEAVDFDVDARGDLIKQLSLGLDFLPTPDTLLKLDYVRGARFDAFNVREDHAGILFSVATYF